MRNEPPPDAVADTEKLNEAMKSEPWTAEEYPFMVRWVEENSPLLDLVAEALRQKHYFVPMLRAPAEKGTIGLPASFHAELTLPHQIIDAFFYRLQYRLGKNDIDGAWRDAAGIARLRIYQHAMIPGKFTYPFDHVLREEELTPEQQEYFLAELNSLPERDSVRETLAICRLKTLWEDAVMASRNSPSFRSLNWNLIAAETNRLYDQLEQAWQQIEKEPARRQQIVDDLQKRLTTKPERSMLEKWLGKPLTVSGRSREFAWASNEFLGQGLVHVLLESDEKALDELRERIEPKKQKPEGSAAH